MNRKNILSLFFLLLLFLLNTNCDPYVILTPEDLESCSKEINKYINELPESLYDSTYNFAKKVLKKENSDLLCREKIDNSGLQIVYEKKDINNDYSYYYYPKDKMIYKRDYINNTKLVKKFSEFYEWPSIKVLNIEYLNIISLINENYIDSVEGRSMMNDAPKLITYKLNEQLLFDEKLTETLYHDINICFTISISNRVDYFEIKLINDDNIITYEYSLGSKVSVLSPDELKDYIYSESDFIS